MSGLIKTSSSDWGGAWTRHIFIVEMFYSYTSLCVTVPTQTCYDLAPESRGRDGAAACSVASPALGSDEHPQWDLGRKTRGH
jgi:hypothetical protein